MPLTILWRRQPFITPVRDKKFRRNGHLVG